MASGVATVKEVVSADTFVLVGCPRGGPPPEKRLSLACVRAPRVAMKSFSHEQQDEPYGFIAREYARKKLIGQTVDFQVDSGAMAAARLPQSGGGMSPGAEESCTRAIGTIKLNGEDIRCVLLKKGLVKLDNYAEAISKDPQVQELERCQKEAKQAGLGMWNSDAAAGANTVRNIQWALNDTAVVKAFAAANKGKRIPAVVEYVRDGGCVRVSLYVDPEQRQLLQDQQHGPQLKEPLKVLYASVLLSGIQCDGFKREQQEGTAGGPAKLVAEPFAESSILACARTEAARFFVETRLLNRDVDVRIEGCDEIGNLYGSLYHPRGNISLLLLQNGLARLHAATAGLTEAGAQMRMAMQEAQQKQLRRWKNWQSSTANVEAKQFTAVVGEVVSGDLLVLQLPDGSERRVYLSSIRCLRGAATGAGGGVAAAGRGTITLKDEDSMAFQAKEFVRKKLVGKKVRVYVDYLREINVTTAASQGGSQQQKMQFVSVYLSGGGGGAKEQSGTTSNGPEAAVPEGGADGQNIAALLIQQGFAKTVQHRADDERAKDYEMYLELEKAAQQRKVGLHAPQQQWQTFRVVDLTGPANVQRAQAHFQQLERIPRLDCIVDYVSNASRFKLRVPSQNLSISFALSGIRSPQAGPRGVVAQSGGTGGKGAGTAAESSSTTSNGFTGLRGSSSRGGGGGGIPGRQAEPFGDEALTYARKRLLQREVRIKIEAIDKGGNFLGTMWASGGPRLSSNAGSTAGVAGNTTKQQQSLQQQQHQGNNFAAELLELGLAHTVEFSLARTIYKDLLLQAEQKAQNAKLKIWSLVNVNEADEFSTDATAGKDVDVDENLPEVVVSHTEKVDLFYIQEANNKNLEKIVAALEQYGTSLTTDTSAGNAGPADNAFTPGGPPRRGDLVLAKFTTDGAWYRARFQANERSSSGKNLFRVMYIDFGNSEALPLERLHRCPPSLREIPPQARPCCLSGLLPPPELEAEAASFFESLTQDLVFCCSIEKIDAQKRRHVILTPQETSGSGKSGVTINEKMLRQGLARLDKKSKTKIFHRLQLEEQAARKAHINVWRYGDCGADDECDSFADKE